MFNKLLMVNLLITGGFGFIASNFINRCKNIDINKIIIIDKISQCSNDNNISKDKKNIFFIYDDILTHNFIETFKKYDIDCVIHFAAETCVDNSYKDFNKFIENNIIATQKLLEDIKNYNKKIILIHFSTDEIYGPSLSYAPFLEEDKFNPTNPYSASKASCEMIINTYKYSYNLPIIIVRCNNVFGKYQYYEKVIPCFILKALDDDYLPIHGNGNKRRDFINVKDVCDAVNILITNREKCIGEIYNVGIDNPIKIIDLANKIIKKIGKGKIKYVEDRSYNDDRYFVNCNKLNYLGWNPKNDTNLDNSLDELIEWYKENKNYWDNKIHKCKNFEDKRGVIKFIDIGGNQQFLSINKKNTLRGIHTSPYGKNIFCISGSFIDYCIDYNTMTYKKYILTTNGIDKVYIPPENGHLFISLEDNSVLLYQLEGKYDEKLERNYNYRCPIINLDISLDDVEKYIISDKDLLSPFYKEIDYLLLGSNGFLGNYTKEVLLKQSKNIVCINDRLENIKEIEKKIKLYKPKYVICSAGISGKPSIDWCENNKIETLNTNITYQLILADICNKLNIHLTLYLSGSIYTKELGNNIDETVKPNNYSKIYLKYRIILEELLENYNNILILRIQYPISFDNNEKCFLNKMKKRLNNVDDVFINTTILPSLFPIIPEMIEDKCIGIYNFVNDGEIKISKLLELCNIKDFNISNNSNSQLGLLNIDKLKKYKHIKKIEEVL